MLEKKISDETMTQYLLGLLSEGQKEQLETLFFQNDDAFEQLTAFEDELIDDYTQGRLPSKFRTAFEKKLQSDPRWKQRKVFAQALARHAEESRSTEKEHVRAPSPRGFLSNLFQFRPAFRIAFATGGVFALAIAVWLGLQLRQQGIEIQALRAERDSLKAATGTLQTELTGLQQRSLDLTRQLEEEQEARLSGAQPDSPALRVLASVVLSPGLIRGNNDVAQIKIPGNSGIVRLELDLATVGEYGSYRAELHNSAGDLIWRSSNLSMRTTSWGKAVVLNLPAERLENGEYELTLQGLKGQVAPDSPVLFYFNVTKG